MISPMHARLGALLFAAALLAACASSTAQAPEVSIVQTSSVPDVRLNVASGLPIELQLRIRNPFDHEVKLVAVEIESVGQSGAYAMKRVRHSFDRAIAAGADDTVDLRAWIQPLQRDDRGDTDQPVMLRGTARFETPAGPMRRNFVTRTQ